MREKKNHCRNNGQTSHEHTLEVLAIFESPESFSSPSVHVDPEVDMVFSELQDDSSSATEDFLIEACC